MMIHDTNNVSKGHNAVSSIATSENSMASNIQTSSHLLMNSKWLNVSTIHDQTLAHGYTMDGYQTHGPPQREQICGCGGHISSHAPIRICSAENVGILSRQGHIQLMCQFPNHALRKNRNNIIK